MDDGFRLLTSVDDLEPLVAGSMARPVLIFKHSLTCGTSAWAHAELESWLAGTTVPVDVVVVHVQRSRDVSDAVAARLGIRHQSPQAILVRNGQAVWDASHYRLSQAALRAATERDADAPTSG